MALFVPLDLAVPESFPLNKPIFSFHKPVNPNVGLGPPETSIHQMKES